MTSCAARNTSQVLARPARLGSLSTRVATTMMPWRLQLIDREVDAKIGW